MSSPTKAEVEFEHGWAETSGRFALDALLRRHGWRIAQRPALPLEPLWWHPQHGACPEGAALATLPEAALHAAHRAETIYYARKVRDALGPPEKEAA